MPRVARIKSEFTTYHIILRGNEKKNIFPHSSDKERFLVILDKAKEKYNFHVYAYCLMDNHLHLIVYDNGNDISLIMKSINVSYAIYFNRKYKRVGHLFQDRYKSEIVDGDKYLLELSKYIHNNPVKAGIVAKAIQYRWSSFAQYVNGDEKDDFLSITRILGTISDKQAVAQREYYKYVTNSELCTGLTLREGFMSAETENRNYISLINDAREKVIEMAESKELTLEEFISNRKYRDEAIRELRRNTSLRLKEIGELLGGLSESRVSRILKL